MKTSLISLVIGILLAPGFLLASPLAYQPLPAKIEAESYVAMSGIQTETSSDDGAGLNVSHIDDNDWMDYDVSVPSAGVYVFQFRIANAYGNGLIEVRNAAGSVLNPTLSVPQTGGWQSWRTITTSLTLPAGNQRIRIFAKQGAFNFNYFEVVAPVSLPGKIEAESYISMNGINTETTTDVGGGLNINWIDDDDWLDYLVKVPMAGTYTFQFRIANAYGNGKIEIRNAAGSVLNATLSVPQTGGWQSWSTISTTATLPAGSQLLRIYARQGAFNLNYFEVTTGGAVVLPQAVLSFTAPANKVVGDAPFDLTVSSSQSGTPILVTSSNASVLSVSNASGSWKATVVGAGSATLTATQAGSALYTAATAVSQTVTVAAAPPFTGVVGTKITLDPKRWYQMNNVSNGLDALFDGITDVDVHTGYGKPLANYDSYYPLLEGESMTLQSIKFFDGPGNLEEYPLKIFIINDQWERIPVATFTGKSYGTWVGPYPDRESVFKLDVPISGARYLIINAWYQYPTEIELYGTHTPATVKPSPAPQKFVKFKDMLGVNGFEWNFEDATNPSVINESRMNVVKNFTGIRHYMDWERLEANEGKYTYNPTHSGGWNYDIIYERCKAAGIEVLACLKNLPNWLQQTYPESERDGENVPLRYGKDFTDPLSYLEQAKVGFQYAARYGSNPNVNPSLVTVNSAQRWTGDGINVVKIGMNVIKYLECDNERDKSWKGRKAYQTGREYAANLSAFYDGHKNTMGPGVGVKNADPNMKVVMGGIASATVDYVKGMIDWCKQYRGYKADGSVNLCWDVINYHFYTDDASSSQSGTSSRGAAPEVTKAALVADSFNQLAHQQAQDMPVWITEAGYDLNQGSPLKAIAIGNKTVEQTQADWILRTALLYARSGIDKLFLYQLYDDNPQSPIQFGSMGLINGDMTRKLATDYLVQVNKLLGEYSYQQTLSTSPFVDRYENNGQSIYALVVPGETGRTVSYTLDLKGAASALVYTPRAGGDAMQVTTVTATNGKVTLTVTETPSFVVPQGTASGGRVAAEALKPTDVSLATLNVYPNPTADYVSIALDNDNLGPVDVLIYDMALSRVQNRIAYKKEKTSFIRKIDLTSLPKGLYLIEVKQGTQRSVKKVIKM